MITICVLAEGALQLADQGVLGLPRLRSTAYEYFGFWPQLLRGWQPNYAAQPFVMFLSYAVFHGGLMHLAFNMFALWSLGRVVAQDTGASGLITIYTAGVVGGAVLHGLMASGLQPMVGASGGLFGLAGALVGWAYANRHDLHGGVWLTIRAIGLLVAINVVMWWALDGQLAWQAHLGGFVAGWIARRLGPDEV